MNPMTSSRTAESSVLAAMDSAAQSSPMREENEQPPHEARPLPGTEQGAGDDCQRSRGDSTRRLGKRQRVAGSQEGPGQPRGEALDEHGANVGKRSHEEEQAELADLRRMGIGREDLMEVRAEEQIVDPTRQEGQRKRA